ncbi:nickel pincer cofactor biosynthesis protein LarC [Aciditerrimonas ferrireducens]|uniref:nickel pincer cofactor biosynthesis protein LarC n=1 Tax=Aciditerrimonas ferrireducens TaxID=667306 RepID=UPI002003704B|nr:nickel pincer cofactor biosynthesis protein LarC [Aciditerrimonas ferrireducens]MCK4175946.1 nickel pincer cofactor biosynthesis protein LarC [Aciditerrimonas ferrireducens]
MSPRAPAGPAAPGAPATTGTGVPSAAGGRVAWLHCFSGIAGDMLLAALLDAGAPQDEVEAVLGQLPLRGWQLVVRRVERGGLAATAVEVLVEDPPDQVRRAGELRDLLEGADLPPPVAERAQAALWALAEAEGRRHGCPPAEVHLHELGGHDTLVDLVGSAAALAALGVSRLSASPVALGTGLLESRHGPLPNPAPATLALLAGRPVTGRDTPRELTTPTGAAVIAAWVADHGPPPPMRLLAAGYGAGRAEEPAPNCLQVLLGEPLTSPAPPAGNDQPSGPGAGAGAGVEQLWLLETTLDDVTGEVLGWLLEELRAAGALDCWAVPMVGKAGRPGQVLTCLCRAADLGALRARLLAETGSLGARSWPVERLALARAEAQVIVAGQPVRVKVGPFRVKAEHRDVARVAKELGLPLHTVAAMAEDAWRAQAGGPGSPAPVGPGGD